MKEDLPRLGDDDKNDILVTSLAFHDIDFMKEAYLSQHQLQEGFSHLRHVVEFGKNNKKTFSELLLQAKETHDRLMGKRTILFSL